MIFKGENSDKSQDTAAQSNDSVAASVKQMLQWIKSNLGERLNCPSSSTSNVIKDLPTNTPVTQCQPIFHSPAPQLYQQPPVPHLSLGQCPMFQPNPTLTQNGPLPQIAVHQNQPNSHAVPQVISNMMPYQSSYYPPQYSIAGNPQLGNPSSGKTTEEAQKITIAKLKKVTFSRTIV